MERTRMLSFASMCPSISLAASSPLAEFPGRPFRYRRCCHVPGASKAESKKLLGSQGLG
jgi:hypothetical protein